MTQWSEMRPWSGGECPVGPDERVRAVFACGETSGFGGLAWTANEFDWSECGNEMIIAYQVEVKPSQWVLTGFLDIGGEPKATFANFGYDGYNTHRLTITKIGPKQYDCKVEEIK